MILYNKADINQINESLKQKDRIEGILNRVRESNIHVSFILRNISFVKQTKETKVNSWRGNTTIIKDEPQEVEYRIEIHLFVGIKDKDVLTSGELLIDITKMDDRQLLTLFTQLAKGEFNSTHTLSVHIKGKIA